MTITDDRGVEREVRSTFAGARFSAAGSVNVVIQLTVATLLGTVVLVLSCIGSSLVVMKFAPESAIGMAVTLFVPFVLSLVVFVWTFNRLFATQFVRESVAMPEGCRACGYDIDRLVVEADGCRVCPECGGAWRVVSGGGGA